VWGVAVLGRRRPLAGGQSGGGRTSPGLSDNPVVGTATRMASWLSSKSDNTQERRQTVFIHERGPSNGCAYCLGGHALRWCVEVGDGGPGDRVVTTLTPVDLGRRLRRWTGSRVKRGRVGVVKPPRARGGCLGVIRISGVGGRDRPGGAAERASIPGCPKRRRELKHLSTCGKGNQPRLPQ
jgi:hypothetical protein